MRRYGQPAIVEHRNGEMADKAIPHFQNDLGVATIRIGVKTFLCCGATPPFDHPHVFLDMGDEHEIVCPYCSTLYQHDPSLGATESDPKDCFLTLDAA